MTCARSGCSGDACFYCNAPLSPRHEHDHMPIPVRNGGVETVAACLNCHDLKDRVPLSHWDTETIFRAFNECGPTGRLLLGKLLAWRSDLAKREAELPAATP